MHEKYSRKKRMCGGKQSQGLCTNREGKGMGWVSARSRISGAWADGLV